jgi:putative CocE/NonD family hydrolase
MLRPPHLKAIVPVYATDDRYTDDVHYLGGCKTLSEMAQYAVSQVAMNALPPKAEYAGAEWASRWRARLEETPPWTLEWLRRQADGPYWRRGSLAPDYDRITCAILHIGGWNDGYTNAVLRMQARCVNAPRKALIGNWVHAGPDYAYPGPNLDWLREMLRFFDHWLKGIDNGVMEEPALVYLRREFTPPVAFPPVQNGTWQAASAFPVPNTQWETYYLGEGSLSPEAPAMDCVHPYRHRPTWGTSGGLCFGAGMGPNGLARDLRPDEALALTFSTLPLEAPVDIAGFPEAVLHLRCTAPVGHVVVRLSDVAPDGVSALVSTGVLNLTHRDGHSTPQALEPGVVYSVRVPFKAAGYRFLAGHRIRLTVASALWPVIWPSPYIATNELYTGPLHTSHLLLPVVPPVDDSPRIPPFKTTPPELEAIGDSRGEPPVWEIVEDLMAGSVTVRVRDGDTSTLPDGTELHTAEEIEMVAYHEDPAHVRMQSRVVYRLVERGYATEVRAHGAMRSTGDQIHFDLRLEVLLNDAPFFARNWLETVPRLLM